MKKYNVLALLLFFTALCFGQSSNWESLKRLKSQHEGKLILIDSKQRPLFVLPKVTPQTLTTQKSLSVNNYFTPQVSHKAYEALVKNTGKTLIKTAKRNLKGRYALVGVIAYGACEFFQD